MERQFLERERLRIEYERRREQERIMRERDELRRQQEQLRYEQERRNVKRPFDMDGRSVVKGRGAELVARSLQLGFTRVFRYIA